MNPEVFAINFMRHQFVPLPIRRIACYAVFGYLALNAVFLITLCGMMVHSFVSQQILQIKFQREMLAATALHAMKEDMAEVQTQAVQDLNYLNAVLALRRERFPMAGKLAAITETLPARTWIHTLSADHEKRSLKIQAVYLIDPEKPYDFSCKTWLDALKAYPGFNGGLKKLELGPSSRTQQGETHLFSYELLAEWQPAGGR